jgi:hypothetical protein
VAVEEVLPAANTTDTTVFAVILLLRVVIVEKVALHAGVGAKRNPTKPAI